MIRREVGPQSPGFPRVRASAVPSPGGGSIPAGPPPVPRSGLFITGACQTLRSNWPGPLSASILARRSLREKGRQASAARTNLPHYAPLYCGKRKKREKQPACASCVFSSVWCIRYVSAHTPNKQPPPPHHHTPLFFVLLCELCSTHLANGRAAASESCEKNSVVALSGTAYILGIGVFWCFCLFSS